MNYHTKNDLPAWHTAKEVPPSCPTYGTLITVKNITPNTPPVKLNTRQRGDLLT